MRNIRAKSVKFATDKGLLQAYNGNLWVFEDRDSILLKLFLDKLNILDGHCCDNEDEIKSLVGERRFQIIDTWLEKARNGDKQIKKRLHEIFY